MFQKFYELFNALNEDALTKIDDDLTIIEHVMCELVDAWAVYLMSRKVAPTEEELKQLHECIKIVSRF